MLLYIGADHRGFELKNTLKDFFKQQGYEVFDVGNSVYDEGDDYPDFASAVAKEVAKDPDNIKGIVICGSGAGADIAANKFRGVRATLALSGDQVFDARHDDNINILALAADYLSADDAKNLARLFIETKFSPEDRFRRRIDKISKLENA
jgi:ribose 5-phosphate isomerase B